MNPMEQTTNTATVAAAIANDTITASGIVATDTTFFTPANTAIDTVLKDGLRNSGIRFRLIQWPEQFTEIVVPRTGNMDISAHAQVTLHLTLVATQHTLYMALAASNIGLQ